MSDLQDDLEILHSLGRTRERAKEVREQGLRLLREIKQASLKNNPRWNCSDNEAEVALLVKVQNHHNLSQDEEENYKAGADTDLTKTLLNLSLKKLFPGADNDNPDEAVPVLVAALALQALTARAKTVFSKASMFCYYRVIRELYYAASPDWTIGAARAGKGGRTSAFITCECIRAIQAFESAVKRTVSYLDHTRSLHDRYLQLNAMIEGVEIKASESPHPLEDWAQQAIERMWLDWIISTDSRNGSIVLHAHDKKNQILPLLSEQGEAPPISMQTIKTAFEELRADLIRIMARDEKQLKEVHKEIEKFRESGEPDSPPKPRTQSAYLTAQQVIFNTLKNAKSINKEIRRAERKNRPLDTGSLLKLLHEKFKTYPAEIRRVLESAQRYVRTVLDRELALAHSDQDFDGGELVFAATAFGSATGWRRSDRLQQACEYLENTLCEGRRLVTHRPFHADSRGYKLLPDGFEMMRCVAKLMHRSQYAFKPVLADKMLNIFLNEKQYLRLDEEDENGPAGWIFENAPDTRKPYAWVTAVSVQALDRLVRMLNERINEMVFKHFKIIRPNSPHSQLTLNDMIYPDYGLSAYYNSRSPEETKRTSIAIRLEQMRAHLMRCSLPEKYRQDESGNKEKVSSAILYGPPGTGKTSLIEALALSANVPLVMLSPGDLIVQGQEQLESRARAVFDALSMLSQAVILFDEFEPVLRRRTLKQQKGHQEQKNKEGAQETAQPGNWNALVQAISEGSTSMLKFLVTGMLPKLVTLHDAAERQSLVYCLATNHLEQIDDAAKRGGRFDVRQPIYKPDPLSRAGTFLFRLQPTAQKLKQNAFLRDTSKQQTFARIIAATNNKTAGELDKCFRTPKPKGKDDADIFVTEAQKRSFSYYILRDGADPQKLQEDATKAINEMTAELGSVQEELSDDEKQERDWLLRFENHVSDMAKSVDAFSLKNCLSLAKRT
jgi:hypothetical protein